MPYRPRQGHTARKTGAVAPVSTSTPSPFDQIARTDAEGNAFWSARDLMPLMGYAAWREFTNPLYRARKSAKNAGLTCQFMRFHKVIKRPQGGTTKRADVHLDRMAAYLVAMNGDPNKPEVAAAQVYFAMQTRRAELGGVGSAEAELTIYPRLLPPRCARANLQPCSPHLV